MQGKPRGSPLASASFTGEEGCPYLGGACRLADGAIIQAFAHCSLLLTLVGTSQRSILSPGGRKENKNISPDRRVTCGVQASLSLSL